MSVVVVEGMIMDNKNVVLEWKCVRVRGDYFVCK